MTPNARDKELAEEAALEWAEAMHAYARLGPARLPDLATIIASALTKQRVEFEAELHERAERNTIAYKAVVHHAQQAESALGALQLQFELRGEIIERLTQERDRAVAETVELAAKECEHLAVAEPDVHDGLTLQSAAIAIRSLAPKVEKEETPMHEVRHMPTDLLNDIIEEFDESAEVTRNSNVDRDGNWSEEEIDQPAKARFEWLVQTANQLRAMLKAESADTGRQVRPHRSGGGHWVEPFDLPLPAKTESADMVSVPSDADKYRALRTTGICDGTMHFQITDEMDAAIGKALAAAGAKE